MQLINNSCADKYTFDAPEYFTNGYKNNGFIFVDDFITIKSNIIFMTILLILDPVSKYTDTLFSVTHSEDTIWYCGA